MRRTTQKLMMSEWVKGKEHTSYEWTKKRKGNSNTPVKNKRAREKERTTHQL
jgi:hypothetical protein